MSNTETWKDVVGFEGKYAVSDIGNVRTAEHFIKHNIGGGMRKVGERMRKLQNQNGGYKIVALGKSNMQLVHRLVATAFIPNPEGKEFVNHKNGIKTDNRVENLEWVTRQENETHAYSTGLKNSTGSSNQMAKLDERKVKSIRYLKNVIGVSLSELAQRYTVSPETISRIARGVIWKHVA